jgi:maltose alpha-D-glucosyltransferase/alpha-amylase
MVARCELGQRPEFEQETPIALEAFEMEVMVIRTQRSGGLCTMASQRHVAAWARTGRGQNRNRSCARTGRRRRVVSPEEILVPAEKDPLWYKDAIIYELHVRAFYDSNADGVGDFAGLTQKLDYLRELGVTAIWLLPFYPSPLKDDGYDIGDYYSIHPIYGTLKDFKQFLQEAHRHELRVITELVVNHTSDQHPWFQRSRHAPPGSVWRDFYVWSDTPDRYADARIIFRDFEPSNWTWDPVARAYFWHRFYSHQPDLNYDNPQVHKEITRVLDFWMDMGVDGFRLDAVPYLYERQGTSCENLPETHHYLKELRRHVDSKYGDRMLLAEANQWPEDAVTYFGTGTGDECHMAFHFPLMPRIFMALRMEDRVPIVDILEQTPAIPETSQWALFLRNHDELTLEMVTDEERDYMYRVYANDPKARINFGIRRRLSPLLGNDRKRIELLNLLLFSLPGAPVLYYGDEIGMGDNVFLGDRNGVRTPMQWSSDRNAGFSRASPHALYFPIIQDPEFHYEAVNVEAQTQNPNSLFWWMKRTLTFRKRFKAFGRGTLEFLKPDNRKVLAFVRRWEAEIILVVANLSRFPQPVRLDLAEFRHYVPIELFGRTEFPAIEETGYVLTLSPHAAFWFSLEPAAARGGLRREQGEPALSVPENWEQILEPKWRGGLEQTLPDYLVQCRWFGGKGRAIKYVQIRDEIPAPFAEGRCFVLVLLVEYIEGEPDEYLIPLGFATEEEAGQIRQAAPGQVVARLRIERERTEGILYGVERTKRFARGLLESIGRRRCYSGSEGQVRAGPLPGWSGDEPEESLEPVFRKAEQSNTSVTYGRSYFLKLFRRLEPGMNPDLEMGRFLTEKRFPNVPAVAGSLEYRRSKGELFTVGILTRLLADAQDAWVYALDTLSRYFDRVRTAPMEEQLTPQGRGSLLTLASRDVPQPVAARIGTFLELARLLGQRTGEMHVCLASDKTNRDFAPEPFTPFYQRALFQSMRNQAVQNLQFLKRSLDRLAPDARAQAERVLDFEHQILTRLRAVYQTRISAKRIRCHGDFHLGQVLYTGTDFVFIDFEGEPARPLGERRIKRSPFRDVTGMIRSFDYITHMALFKQVELGTIQEQELPQLEPWTSFWYRWVSAVFLRAYLEVVKATDLLPQDAAQLEILLEAQLFEKAIYEVGYELNNRPNWVKIPLRGILGLLEENHRK